MFIPAIKHVNRSFGNWPKLVGANLWGRQHLEVALTMFGMKCNLVSLGTALQASCFCKDNKLCTRVVCKSLYRTYVEYLSVFFKLPKIECMLEK